MQYSAYPNGRARRGLWLLSHPYCLVQAITLTPRGRAKFDTLLRNHVILMECLKVRRLVIPCPSSNYPTNSQTPSRQATKQDRCCFHSYPQYKQAFKNCLTYVRRVEKRTTLRKLPSAGRLHVGYATAHSNPRRSFSTDWLESWITTANLTEARLNSWCAWKCFIRRECCISGPSFSNYRSEKQTPLTGAETAGLMGWFTRPAVYPELSAGPGNSRYCIYWYLSKCPIEPRGLSISLSHCAQVNRFPSFKFHSILCCL